VNVDRRSAILWAPVVLVVAAAAGAVVAVLALPVVHNRYFPWIVGRGLGLSAYVALTGLTAVGLWMRHPWRLRWPLLHPETVLRLHATLAASTVVLVAGHLVSLASDRYAGVGWRGALLPGASVYRSIPVAIGVAAFWAMLAVAASARLGAALLRGRWLLVHQLSMPIFAAVFVHGVLAGTDTVALRAAYAATGLAIAGLWVTRRLAAPVLNSPSARAPLAAPLSAPDVREPV
jgi:hypothetical protein